MALIAHSYLNDCSGIAKTLVRRWGVRTFLNMLFTLALVPFLHAYFTYISDYLRRAGTTELVAPFVFDGAMVAVVAALYIWFWFHIQPEQGTKEGLATQLAVYDRGRLS